MDYTRFLTLGLFSCLLLTGCDTDPSKPENQANNNENEKAALQQRVSAEFICSHLLVKTDFFGDDLTLTIEDKSYQLSQTPSASGSKFENKATNTLFWQKGDSATLEFNGQRFSNCEKVTIQRSDTASKKLTLPFTARGNEPGWLLTVNNDQFELIADYGQTTISDVFAKQPLLRVGHMLEMKSEQGNLTLLAENKLCHDSMSGVPYPYTVSIKTEEETLIGCGGEPRSLLTKNSWSVLTVANNMLAEESRISLNFNAESQLSGIASCNRYTSSYNLTGEGLTVSPITTTLMACEPSLMEQEANFLKHLANVSRFDITEHGQLILHTSQGETIKAQPGKP
ncbi:META domain-containing protein [Kangiella sp.]|uniref:META domain-containing protein n=1 Tax=Kangiella sp. TaxID=1920245 RepID=UPI003A8C9D29